MSTKKVLVVGGPHAGQWLDVHDQARSIVIPIPEKVFASAGEELAPAATAAYRSVEYVRSTWRSPSKAWTFLKPSGWLDEEVMESLIAHYHPDAARVPVIGAAEDGKWRETSVPNPARSGPLTPGTPPVSD